MSLRLSLPNPFGGAIWYKERTASTMDDIRALIRRGEPEGTVAIAGFQEAGRGRFADRRWEAGPGEALLFSIALRAPRPASGDPPASFLGALDDHPPASLRAPRPASGDPPASFPGAPDDHPPASLRAPRPASGDRTPALTPSLRLALGVAQFLESLGLKPVIKWPNDLLLDERKVCGILVVSSGGWLYGGIGLNLRQSRFPDKLRRPATSLLLAGRDLAPEEALSGLLPWLQAAYFDANARFEAERRLWHLYEEVEVEEQPTFPPRRGRASGLAADGALLLETPTGTVRCIVGE